jgi:hypothetical protein
MSTALEVIARPQVEHLDRMVHFRRDEEMAAIEIHGEAIEVANDLGQMGRPQQRHRRLLTSDRRGSGHGDSERDEECAKETAFHLDTFLVRDA